MSTHTQSGHASALSESTGSAGSDPVCGLCGKRLSQHFHEDQEYCFEATTGDTFTDDPSHDMLASWLEFQNPTLYRSLVADWRRDHGHLPNNIISPPHVNPNPHENLR